MNIYRPIASFAAQSKAEEILLHPNCTQKDHESHRKEVLLSDHIAILIHGFAISCDKSGTAPISTALVPNSAART
jgi:hypothetical protein